MSIIKEPARGIYLLPNLLTTAALFAGFYAVIQTLKMHFEIAVIAIFTAMIADNLDGRVARLTNTQTAFGAEYDSLSDMVSFGIAPAVLAFNWGLYQLGNFGWFAAFLYVAAAALRLARFNTQLGIADKQYFQGLPSPPAAAMIAGFVWVGEDCGWRTMPMHWLTSSVFAGLVILSAALMVSRIRYNGFKQLNWQGRVPFVSLLLVVVLVAFISLDTSAVLLGLSVIFGFSGPVMTLWRLRQRRLSRKHLLK